MYMYICICVCPALRKAEGPEKQKAEACVVLVLGARRGTNGVSTNGDT